jgi:ABC-2 type transport system permease protein
MSPHPSSLRFNSLKIWWIILRISLEERLVYRGDFMLGTVVRFLPIITQIFLWSAVYSSIEATHPNTNKIVGYSFNDMIAYNILVMLGRAFSSMPGLASGIARDIRSGMVKKYLIQPIDMLGFLFIYRIAHKLVYYLVAALPFATVIFLCRGFFPTCPDAFTMSVFLSSLMMSFLLGFFIEATLGFIGFWFLEINSLLFVYMLFNFFFSGHMFPLDMLPGLAGQIVKLTPFQYLAYFPAAVFLGKIHGSELIVSLIVQLGWVIFFYAASRLAFKLGTSHYSGYGG